MNQPYTEFSINRYEHNSLNFRSRRQEMMKIGYENIVLLHRILSKNGEYDVLKWEKDFRRHLNYRQNILKFPHNWRQLLAKEDEERIVYRKKLQRLTELKKRYADATDPVKNVLKVAKNNKEVKKNVDRRKVVSKSNFNKGSDKMDKTKKFHDNSEYTEERTDVDEENIINEESDDYESDKERIVSDGEVSSSEEDILDRLIGSLMEGNDNGICDSSRKCRNKQKPKTPVYQINSNKNYKFKKFIKPNRNKI
ncbi:uncharacterized protein LOC111616327 [Centruroides sculpturatus]|uniref:uncharacterized protein LOC111616327 n=1 Tax=Centruroides sculpturatus TaxID=218467 RepID=UPI000C6CD77B|nr:uncharacterized protein LOC111616327 [Centruroides sculpturatus]